jgi:RNase H-fold protein (predicted Holliday junction resolvase)
MEPTSPSADRPAGKLLALDVGLARIGVAVCDPLQLAARPLTVIHAAAATKILPCWQRWCSVRRRRR